MKMAYLKQHQLEVYSVCILLVTLLFSFHGAFAVEEETILIHGVGYLESSVLAAAPAIVENNSSLVLAETRTYRRDPLDYFKRYRGGWNLSDEHYWAVQSHAKVVAYAAGLIDSKELESLQQEAVALANQRRRRWRQASPFQLCRWPGTTYSNHTATPGLTSLWDLSPAMQNGQNENKIGKIGP